MLKEHLNLEIKHMGEINGIKFMRKFYNYYIQCEKNASKYRSALVTLDSEKEINKMMAESEYSQHDQQCMIEGAKSIMHDKMVGVYPIGMLSKIFPTLF